MPCVVDPYFRGPDSSLDEMIPLLLEELELEVVPEPVHVEVHLTTQTVVLNLGVNVINIFFFF